MMILIKINILSLNYIKSDDFSLDKGRLALNTGFCVHVLNHFYWSFCGWDRFFRFFFLFLESLSTGGHITEFRVIVSGVFIEFRGVYATDTAHTGSLFDGLWHGYDYLWCGRGHASIAENLPGHICFYGRLFISGSYFKRGHILKSLLYFFIIFWYSFDGSLFLFDILAIFLLELLILISEWVNFSSSLYK